MTACKPIPARLAVLRPFGNNGGRAFRWSIALLPLVWGLVAPSTTRADLTYEIVGTSDSLFGTISGTITTDGNTGALDSSDFVAWDIHIEPLIGNSLTLTSNGSGPTISLSSHVTATATGLEVLTNFRHPFRSDELSISDANGHALSWFPASILSPAGWLVTTDSFPYLNGGGSLPWGSATFAVLSAPEPSTAMLAALGAFGLLAYGWDRSRAARKKHNAA